jgi:hypothetical protein
MVAHGDLGTLGRVNDMWAGRPSSGVAGVTRHVLAPPNQTKRLGAYMGSPTLFEGVRTDGRHLILGQLGVPMVS